MKGKRTKVARSKDSAESAAKPSKATRDLVAIAAGGGTPAADIACALGIELSTLLRVYRKELSTLAFRKRVELVQTMYGQAKKGNTGAAKAYLAMQPAIVAPPAKPTKAAPSAEPETTPAPPEPAADASTDEKVAPPKPVKLGKKEAANINARTAQVGSGWESLLPDHNRQQ